MKYILFTLVLFCTIQLSAQQPTKWQANRAVSVSEFIAQDLDLTEADKKFVHDVLLTQIVENQTKTKGLTQAEKVEIYKASGAKTRALFVDKYGRKMAAAIMSANTKFRNQAK